MNYFKIIFRTGEEDWEIKELIINENQNGKIQEQMSNGGDFIFIKNQTIKRTSIVSITSANQEIAEYQRQGIKVDGLLEPVEKPKEITGRIRKFGDIFTEKKDELYKRMNWKMN